MTDPNWKPPAPDATPSVSGVMNITIKIDGDVHFTLGPLGQGLEVHAINAGADVANGLVAFDPPVAIADTDVAKLRLVLIDALISHVAHETRRNLQAAGGGPTIEIHNEPLKTRH